MKNNKGLLVVMITFTIFLMILVGVNGTQDTAYANSTSSPSSTPSHTPSPTSSSTPSPSSTPSRTPSPTPSRTPSPTPSRTPSPTPTHTHSWVSHTDSSHTSGQGHLVTVSCSCGAVSGTSYTGIQTCSACHDDEIVSHTYNSSDPSKFFVLTTIHPHAKYQYCDNCGWYRKVSDSNFTWGSVTIDSNHPHRQYQRCQYYNYCKTEQTTQNTTYIESCPTCNTSPPTATIACSPAGPFSGGNVITITATFNENVKDSPIPQISISGAGQGLSAANMSKSSAMVYRYTYTVAGGEGTANVTINNVRDMAGNAGNSTSSFSVRVSPPSGLSWGAAGQASLVFNWSPNGNPSTTKYQTILYDASNNVVADSGWMSNTLTYTFNNLSPGTKYHAKVRAQGVDGYQTPYKDSTEKWTTPSSVTSLTGTCDGLAWSKTEGRGYVTLSWGSVPNAMGYKVAVFDGNVYRLFDVGNVYSWDSRNAKLYPAESTLSSYGANSQSGDLFNHSATGLDLRDNPNKLYLKTVGTQYDTNTNYWFRIVAYNSSGDADLYKSNAYMPTLPSRTDVTPPSGTFTINGGAPETTSENITLNFSINDAESGIADIGISENPDINSAIWHGRFDNEISYKVTKKTELKTIYVWLKDSVGNITAAPNPLTQQIVYIELPAHLATLYHNQVAVDNKGNEYLLKGIKSKAAGYTENEDGDAIAAEGYTVPDGLKVSYLKDQPVKYRIEFSIDDDSIADIIKDMSFDLELNDTSEDGIHLKLLEARLVNYNPKSKKWECIKDSTSYPNMITKLGQKDYDRYRINLGNDDSGTSMIKVHGKGSYYLEYTAKVTAGANYFDNLLLNTDIINDVTVKLIIGLNNGIAITESDLPYHRTTVKTRISRLTELY